MNVLVSTLTAALFFTACSTTHRADESAQKPLAFHYMPGVSALHAPNLADRSLAAEGQHITDRRKARTIEVKSPGRPSLRMTALVRRLQTLDEMGLKLRRKVGENRYRSTIKDMSEAEDAFTGSVFRDAYVAEFPSESPKVENLLASIKASELAEDVAAKKAALAEMKSYYDELARGLSIPADPTVGDIENFYRTYFERATAKLKKEKISAGVAFGIATIALEHSPKVQLGQASDKLTPQQRQLVKTLADVSLEEGKKYLAVFTAKFGLDNVFGPVMRIQMESLERVK